MIDQMLKVGIQQRVLPFYRGEFFDSLAKIANIKICVFAGNPRPIENLGNSAELKIATHYTAKNLHIFSGAFYLNVQSNIRSWLRMYDPEVLILEANPRYLHLPSVIHWMHKRHRPVIGWGLGSPDSTSPLIRWVKSKWLQQFDALISYSLSGKRQYSALGFPADKIIVAPNAVTHRPQENATQRGATKKASDIKVLFVGRLQKRKQIDMLIKACAALPPDLQPRLEIVGEGEARPELETLVAEIYPNTRFHGAVYESDLNEIYRQADIFVLPGSGGLAVQQAMSHALPVIVAEADGTQQDLVNSKNGWLIPSGESAALQQTLLSALQDIPRLRTMGTESLRIVRDEVNIEYMVECFRKAIALVHEDAT